MAREQPLPWRLAQAAVAAGCAGACCGAAWSNEAGSQTVEPDFRDTPLAANSAVFDEPVAAELARAWAGRAAPARVTSNLQAPRVTEVELQAVPGDVALANANAGSTQGLAGVSYRWWLQRGRADVGFGLGTLGYVNQPVNQPLGAGGAAGSGLSATVPTLSVGVRYRVTEQSVVYADALRARSLAASGADGYRAKVGMEWAAKEPLLHLDSGSVGIHLDSGVRMSLRLRKGKVGLYMRSNF